MARWARTLVEWRHVQLLNGTIYPIGGGNSNADRSYERYVSDGTDEKSVVGKRGRDIAERGLRMVW